MQEKANNMATGAKTQNKKKKKSIISKENITKILHAYIALYDAFLLKNLMSGMTLGAASYGALKLLDAKIATMDRQNPVTKLLKRIHKYHTKVVSKHVMTSPYRDAVPNIKPDERAKLASFVSNKFNDATKVLDTMSNQYKPVKTMVVEPKVVAAKPTPTKAPVTAQLNTTGKPAPNRQQLLLIIKMKQMQHQRGAA